MDSFIPFVYKKEEKAAPEQIQLELDVQVEHIPSSKEEDEDTSRVIIIDVL
jgi:hypothetical protein